MFDSDALVIGEDGTTGYAFYVGVSRLEGSEEISAELGGEGEEKN